MADMNRIFDTPLHKGQTIVRPETDNSIPDTVLVVFEDRIMDVIKSIYHLEPVAVLKECSPVTVYSVSLSDWITIGLYQTPVGSPATAIFLERARAKGGKRFLFFGSCGGISDSAVSGTFVIPTIAYRGEGTSFYYAAPSDYLECRCCGTVRRLMEESGLPYIAGPVWSTDAMFRETDELIERMRSCGCIGVEMECSALNAISDYHGIPIAEIFFVDDTIGDEWSTYENSKVVNRDTISKIVELTGKFASEKI